MKVSESWLRSLVNTELSVEQLASQLTMAGLEVDSVSPVAGDFTNVVVAKVIDAEPHPEADKLTICTIDAGDEEPHTVVCGASNVRQGIKVALAKLGATLPGGFKIKKVKLRGQPSCGMLCSGSELGLEEKSDGIMELSEEAPIGQDLRVYMDLNDNMLDIDLTPNRADCFSHMGIAREIAAINNLTLNEIGISEIDARINESVDVCIQATEACPQYYGRMIKNINTEATTPLWLAERLRRSGVRPLHPVVDVTNYVMMAIGQPMHAFDASKLSGSIHVRFAQKQEPITLLDGQEIHLNEKNLVIADEQRALALAGIMGGHDSAVEDQIKHVFLESALFKPQYIAGVARQHGLFTDSSQRFERGVDPVLAKAALDYATHLLLEIVGGEPGPVTFDKQSEDLTAKHIVTFQPEKVEQLTGVELSENKMAEILSSLGFDVVSESTPWQVTVPTHRYDVSFDVDLVEEIIRLYGYQNIQAKSLLAEATSGEPNQMEIMTDNISKFLVSRGYHETISYSFVDPTLQQAIYPGKKALDLLNPISADLSQMRAGLWPGLIASMVHNIHRQNHSMRLFETGVVFDYYGNNVQENLCIAGLMTGKHDAFNWATPERQLDYFDLKGDLEALFSTCHLNHVNFKTSTNPALHPGKSALIMLEDQVIGELGVLHPRFNVELGLTSEVVIFQLNINQLICRDKVQYQKISKYPQIRRDLSMIVDEKVLAAEIEKTINEALSGELLKSFDVFDVYQGQHIPAGKKSIAVTFTLQDVQKTLTDEEINSSIDAILELLKSKHAITLRD